jgi:RNA polymerase sigma factor (sigma-70 family)
MELQAMTALGTRLAGGDARAVEDVYETLGPRVLSYLRRLVPYDGAEDVMQRALFEVWRSRERFDPDRSLEARVFAIARKRAIDHLRRPHHVTVPIELVSDLADADGRVVSDHLAGCDDCRRELAVLAATSASLRATARQAQAVDSPEHALPDSATLPYPHRGRRPASGRWRLPRPPRPRTLAGPDGGADR